MNEIAKVVAQIFGGETNASGEELRVHCLERLGHCQRVLAEFSRPEYRPYIRFALAWREMERQLEEVQRMVSECLGEKAAGPLDELFEQLGLRS